MPLLPKGSYEFKLPPKCPLDSINFIQLRRKEIISTEPEKLGFGFDLIG